MKVSFVELQVAPELALVVAVDRILGIAADALYAAQPEHYDNGEHLSLRTIIAGHIVRDISDLRRVLARYHREVAAELPRERDADLDLPF